MKLLLMPFSRDVEANVQELSAMTSQLRSCASIRAFLCTSREYQLSLQLKAQVLRSIFGRWKLRL